MPDKSKDKLGEKLHKAFPNGLWKQFWLDSDKDAYVSCGNEVKDFIRQLLADRDRELIEKLEGMRIDENYSGHWKNGFYQALSDIIKYIKS